ncbi:tripartite tricarboxylate transporter substrate binding protein [Phreatobacter sp.]|uniref:Bug family tripartite tricarboxylate transporter substrate binding protein n=1 Tax=Phreatobacter sp. TaxID=1966341 RepID=UPI0022BE615D|nr:tripartite tricarboxylate transporter substrate binding protein [Phreatobacter sp.]MCZ8313715.1 tripartite tricarboxylate transporter substrate binding protein [Phreatobacter sp.]
MPRFSRRSLLAACLAAPTLARAQAAWRPTRPITLVVPFTPGGSTDFLARLLGQSITDALGVGVVVENRPGAGGGIASGAVAKAAPDGQTLLLAHIGTLAVNPWIYARLPYDPVRSFAPVSLLAAVHNVLAIHPSVVARSVPELIALAKAAPGSLNYGTGGVGSAAHIATAAFEVAAGIRLQHVPYRGTGPAVSDLLAGRIQMALTGAPILLPQVRAGSLLALGVSGTRRLAALPDVPTIAEAALPGFDASQWYGLVAPAGTPAPVIDTLNAICRTTLSTPAMAARLEQEGADAMPSTPDGFASHIASELARWGAVARAANLKAE